MFFLIVYFFPTPPRPASGRPGVGGWGGKTHKSRYFKKLKK